jgi:hypothetical protein
MAPLHSSPGANPHAAPHNLTPSASLSYLQSITHSVKHTLSSMLSYPNADPVPLNPPSMRWVIIQVLVVWFFWRLITPFLLTTKMSRGYRQARMALDAWLFSALVVHVPAFNSTADNAPSRVFLAVFVFFLVTLHVAIGAAIVSFHCSAWGLNFVLPEAVQAYLGLPGSQTWKSPGLRHLIRSTILLSLSGALGFVVRVHARVSAGRGGEGADVTARRATCTPPTTPARCAGSCRWASSR